MFEFLLEHMPQTNHHFVDVFGGSGVVILNRPRAIIDTYNDIDEDLVNFFRVLRDDSDELIRAIQLTPYSRNEMVAARVRTSDLAPVERARRFFCVAQQCRTGLAQRKSHAPWSYGIDVSCGKAGKSSSVAGWLSHIDGLAEIVERLKGVQVDCTPAVDLIRRYDAPTTFFYCDPPYVHATRTGGNIVYKGEMDDAAHTELAERLQTIDGKAMVSGYRGALYDDVFGDWRRVDDEPRYSPAADAMRQESIWMNYPATDAGGLF